MDYSPVIEFPNRRFRNKESIKVFIAILTLLGLAGLLTACQKIESPAAPSQSEDVVRPIEDLLQKAFATLPDELANQDFTKFQQYFATSDQGADVNGINEVYTWIQDLRAAGTAPAETTEYKLNEFRITNVQARGGDATAHLSLNMSKVAIGDTANAAIQVEQDIALVQVNGQWLISGADKAQVTNLLKAPQ